MFAITLQLITAIAGIPTLHNADNRTYQYKGVFESLKGIDEIVIKSYDEPTSKIVLHLSAAESRAIKSRHLPLNATETIFQKHPILYFKSKKPWQGESIQSLGTSIVVGVPRKGLKVLVLQIEVKPLLELIRKERSKN